MRHLTTLGMVLLLSSCATIFGHNIYQVAISSDPSDASVTVFNRDGGQVFQGTTPTSVTLKSRYKYFRGEVYRVVVTKGQARTEATIKTSISGWYFANIALGGAIGMLIVDPLTGSMWTLPNKVNLTLPGAAATPSSAAAPGSTSTNALPPLQVVLLDAIPDALRHELVPLPAS